MFLRMLKVENIKLYRRSVVWVEMGLMALMMVSLLGMLFVMQIAGAFDEFGDAAPVMEAMLVWPDALMFSMDFGSASNFGGFLVVILVSIVVAQEYNWNTYSLWLRQGVGRPVVLSVKFITLLGASLLLVLTPAVVGGILTGIFTPIIKGSIDFAAINFADLGMSILRTAYTLLPYMTLTFLIAVLTRSLAFSLGIGIGYTMLVEGLFSQIALLIGGFPAKVAVWMPGQMAASLSALNGVTESTLSMAQASAGSFSQLIPDYLEPTTAAIGIAVYSVVFLAAAFIAFQRQDITT